MTRRRMALLVAALVVFVAVAAAAVIGLDRFGRSGAANATRDPERIALGRRVYAERCASCHGVNLEGQPNWQTRRPDGRLPAPPHDATGHTWHHPDEVLFRITKEGLSAIVPGYESDMPAFADALTDEEIAAAIAFIKSTWPPEIRERQAARNRPPH